MHKTTTQQGFSLIELMVVVAIVGILGVVAIPAYKDYLIKAKATEMMSMAQNAKLAVSEALMNGQTLATVNNQGLGLTATTSPMVNNIAIAQGIITITANHANMGLPENPPFTMVLTPTVADNSGIITWACGIPEAGYRKYAPSGCR